MSDLHIQPVDSDSAAEDWRHVHNAVIPLDPLSPEDVRERRHRNRLDVAYRDQVLVGCTTVRPPAIDATTATVIARVLPEYRHQGIGAQLYTRGLREARAAGAERIETIVWAANVDGLRFAQAHGFVEVSRYLPPDEDVAYVTLRLT